MKKPEPPLPPPNRVRCDICGELKGPEYKHRNWLCRFVIWLDKR